MPNRPERRTKTTPPIRRTAQTKQIVELILVWAEGDKTVNSRDIALFTGLEPSLVHLTLRRLENLGWLKLRSERLVTWVAPQPPFISYGLTAKGRREATAYLRNFETRRRKP